MLSLTKGADKATASCDGDASQVAELSVSRAQLRPLVLSREYVSKTLETVPVGAINARLASLPLFGERASAILGVEIRL